MSDKSQNFGKGEYSPLERKILRLQWLWQKLGSARMKVHYRDRLSMGVNCRVDPWSIIISGTGAVVMEDDVAIDRGAHKVLFNLGADSQVTLKKETWIQTFDSHTVFSTKPGATIEIGERCWFSGGIFGASERITVGEHGLIGWGCMILDSSLHRLDNDSPPVKTAPVTIGSHVWMPSYVTVFPGVRIGDHCVIGTGSLVTKDVPDNSFAAGRPARVIRKIGNRDQVE